MFLCFCRQTGYHHLEIGSISWRLSRSVFSDNSFLFVNQSRRVVFFEQKQFVNNIFFLPKQRKGIDEITHVLGTSLSIPCSFAKGSMTISVLDNSSNHTQSLQRTNIDNLSSYQSEVREVLEEITMKWIVCQNICFTKRNTKCIIFSGLWICFCYFLRTHRDISQQTKCCNKSWIKLFQLRVIIQKNYKGFWF